MKELNSESKFSEIIGHLRASLDQLYNLTQKSDSAMYEGYSYSDILSVSNKQPDFELSARGLKKANENYEDDAIDVILGIAFKLGYCQGDNMASSRLNEIIDIKDKIIDALLIKKEPEKKE